MPSVIFCVTTLKLFNTKLLVAVIVIEVALPKPGSASKKYSACVMLVCENRFPNNITAKRLRIDFMGLNFLSFS